MTIRDQLRSSAIFNFNQVERDRWIARQAAALPAGSVVLDVGAGSCPYRPLFTHCEYRTQDFQQLKVDDLRGGHGYGKIDYVCDASNIPVPDGTFDAVICTEMLEHVPEPMTVIRELARVLKSGGKLILTAPLGSGIHQAPHHYYGGYTPFWFERFLREAGFTDVRVEANSGFFRHFAQESIRFVRLAAPWGKGARGRRLLFAPVWLMLAPLFAVAVPLVCYAIDPIDDAKEFTIGYHVTAIRQR